MLYLTKIRNPSGIAKDNKTDFRTKSNQNGIHLHSKSVSLCFAGRRYRHWKFAEEINPKSLYLPLLFCSVL